MIRMAMDVLKILSDHYPERLGSAFMVHPSWSFTFFWKSISPFIDNVTKKKIFFVKKLDELKDWIDEDVLEEEYGGKNEVVYSYDLVAGRDDKLYPPHNEAGQLVDAETGEPIENAEKKKKKKKKKAAVEGEEAEVAAESSEVQSAAASSSEPSEAKKSKKSKKNADASATEASANDEAGEEEPSASESSKKATNGASPESPTEGTDDSAVASKKKKSKKTVTETD